MAYQELTGMLKVTFSGTDPKSIPTLSVDNVKRLPKKVASLLCKLGTRLDLGDLTILTIEDLKHRPTVLRAIQWLENGEYEPFITKYRFQVCASADDEPVMYDSKLHELNPSFHAASKTQAYFVEEAKLYAFSVLADFKELQRHSARRIMSRYPVYTAEISALLTELLRNNITNLRAVDSELADFIGRRISCCQSTLLDAQVEHVVLPFLRSIVEPKKHFLALLHMAKPECVQKGVAELKKYSEPRDELSVLLDAFVDTEHTQLPVSTTPARLYKTPSDENAITSGDDEYRAVFRVLADQRILVAGKDGYGTLRLDRNGAHLPATRNVMFRFQQGELLLKVPQPSFTVNGPNDLVVRNQQGEVGEVFKGLSFRPVKDFINRANAAANLKALPSPASIKSETNDMKRPYSGEDLFANRGSRRRFQ